MHCPGLPKAPTDTPLPKTEFHAFGDSRSVTLASQQHDGCIIESFLARRQRIDEKGYVITLYCSSRKYRLAAYPQLLQAFL